MLSLDKEVVFGLVLWGFFFSLLSFVSYHKATHVHHCKIVHNPHTQDHHHKYFGVLLQKIISQI